MALTVGVDSYITLVEAEAYILDEINHTSWDALDDITKENYLRIAYDYMQMLGMVLTDPAPDCVMRSQAIMANTDVNAGLSMDTGSSEGEIKRVQADVVSVEYVENTSSTASRYEPRVRTCLSSYGATFSSQNSIRLSRT